MIPNVLLVTERNMQNTALEHEMESILHFQIITPSCLIADMGLAERYILLLDISVLSDEVLRKIINLISFKVNKAKVALFNCDSRINIKMIYDHLDVISGVFYRDGSIESLATGITVIARGEMFFSRLVAINLLKCKKESLSYRKKDAVCIPEKELTRRESQILHLLMKPGRTLTSEIAQELYISENTVKTHMSHLFRKIGVRNRTEAVAWLTQQEGQE